jgi:hypothetical protein
LKKSIQKTFDSQEKVLEAGVSHAADTGLSNLFLGIKSFCALFLKSAAFLLACLF